MTNPGQETAAVPTEGELHSTVKAIISHVVGLEKTATSIRDKLGAGEPCPSSGQGAVGETQPQTLHGDLISINNHLADIRTTLETVNNFI